MDKQYDEPREHDENEFEKGRTPIFQEPETQSENDDIF